MRLLKNLLVNYSIKHVARHTMPIAAITSRNIVKNPFYETRFEESFC